MHKIDDHTKALLADIRAFLTETGMAETTFGQKSVRDWKLLPRLRAGGQVLPRTEQRIRDFMATNAPCECRTRKRAA